MSIIRYSSSSSIPLSSLNIYAALGGSIKAEPPFSINQLTATVTLASQTMRLLTVYLPAAATITGVKWACPGSTPVYTASNFNGFGLYTYAAGTLTNVASSTNDGAVWSAFGPSAPWGSKAFSSTYAAQAGVYYIAALFSASSITTALSVSGAASMSTFETGVDFTNSAKLFGTISSQTTMPSSIAASSINTIANQPYFALY